jgi:hypothetical protein
VYAADKCFHLKEQDEVGCAETFYTHSAQMAKYSDKTITRFLAKEENQLGLWKHGNISLQIEF